MLVERDHINGHVQALGDLKLDGMNVVCDWGCACNHAHCAVCVCVCGEGAVV